MEKEFVPYEQALALKELGFDEPCFSFYDESLYFPNNKNQYGTFCNQPIDAPSCSAPLYQQAFRWFREKYDIFGYCYIPNESGYWGHSFENKAKYDTYEEAELEFLKELIEIVKNK